MAFTFGTLGQADASNVTSHSVSVSASAGDAVYVAVRWAYGPGGAARTISSVSCSGETCAIVGSYIESTTSWRLQWVKIDQVASGGSKSITVTLDGQTDRIFLDGFAIDGAASSGTTTGATNTGGSAFGTAEITLTTTEDNSAIIAVADANSAITVRTGFTDLGFQNTSTSTNRGFYDDDAGTAGNKTVGVDNSSGVWAISAVEILPDAGGGGTVVNPLSGRGGAAAQPFAG